MDVSAKGMPRASEAIIAITVRSPGPTSAAPETTVSVPSLLITTEAVDGLPPAPWLQVCAAKPIPWKTPGRTSLAFGACHLSLQPIAAAAFSMHARSPGLSYGTLPSTSPASLMFLSRMSSGFMLMA